MMGRERPFRFGVVGGGDTSEAYAECARRAEAIGYDVLLCPDHLDLGGAHFSSLSPIPALSYAAAATTQIRLGTSVLNQDLHHPAVLARELASLDVLSDGRLEVGLGAGWAEYEYEWAGIRFDPAPTRVERFEEYVQVVKALLEQESTTFAGKHFQITDMPGIPRPRQAPRPPLLIGATGPRMLRFAAAEADIIGLNLNGPIPGTPERMDERVGWVREAAGSRLDQLEINNIVGPVRIGEGDRLRMVHDERIRQRDDGMNMIPEGMTDEQLLDSPMALIGSVEQLVEEILGWRERWGISYVITAFDTLEEFAPVVERLAGR